MNWIGWLGIGSMIAFMILGLARGRVTTVEQFAVAGHRVGNLPLWSAMIAAWSSAFTLFSPAEFAFTNGVQGLYWHIYLNLGLWAAIPVVMMMKRLFPEGQTLPQYLGERFNQPSRVLSALSIVMFGIIENGAIVFLGATTLQVLGGVPFLLGALLIGSTYVLYVIWGGLSAVVWTDTARLLIYVWVAVLVVPAVIFSAGGTQEIYNGLIQTEVDSTLLLRASPFVMLTFLLSHMAAVAYGPLWQRAFAARNTGVVDRMGPVWYFGWAPFAITGAVLGVVAKAFLSDSLNSPSDAVAATISEFAPPWAQAVFIVGFLAILLSTADTNVNTACAVWCVDIHGVLNPNASDRIVLFSGRVIALLAATASFLLGMFFVQGALNALLYMFSTLAAFAPPIILGLLWQRISGMGAFWGIVVGSATTVYMIFAGFLDAPLGGLLAFVVPMTLAATVTILLSLLKPEPVREDLVFNIGRDKPIKLGVGWGAIAIFLALFSMFPFFAGYVGWERMIFPVFSMFMWLPVLGGVTLLVVLFWGYRLDRSENTAQVTAEKVQVGRG